MRSCWSCAWRKEDDPTMSDEVDLGNPPTVIGICYAYIKERGGPMEIQATKSRDGRYLADVGCKKWTDIPMDLKALGASLKSNITEEEL